MQEQLGKEHAYKKWNILQIFKETLNNPCNIIKKYGLDQGFMK